jgi:RimJ/RimL family protein N-acetyltransferase
MVSADDRIRLRTLEKSDLELKVKWINDPEVNATLYFEIPLGLAKTERWFEKAIADDSRRDFLIETVDAEPIGLVGLIGISWIHRTAETYIVVGNQKYWGKGIGTSALSMMVHWAFHTLGLHKIWGTAISTNLAAIKMQKKVGFKTEGTLREEMYFAGKRVDIVRVGLLRDEFYEKHPEFKEVS